MTSIKPLTPLQSKFFPESEKSFVLLVDVSDLEIKNNYSPFTNNKFNNPIYYYIRLFQKRNAIMVLPKKSVWLC